MITDARFTDLSLHCNAARYNRTITITITPESENGTAFRAQTGIQQATGRSVGTALDALVAKLDTSTDSVSGTLVLVQRFQPDSFFTAEQQQRLGQLMEKWRSARDAGQALSVDEQSELEALTTAELRGMTARAKALLSESQK